MPANLSVIFGISPKKLRLTALFLLSPLIFYAQTLTGLWIGALSSDSTTVRKDQSFEIALTEYKGKVYGYSRSEFIVDDVLYFMVKRVKGTIEGDLCEVKDDEIIAYNFPGKLDKGVRLTSTFRRNINDNSWYLEGTWKTNQTKNFYAVTGKIILEEEKDLSASKIFPHLEELSLANDVAFYKDRVEGAPIVKIAKPEKPLPAISLQPEGLSASSETVTITKPSLQKAESKTMPSGSLASVPEKKMDDPKNASDIKPNPVIDHEAELTAAEIIPDPRKIVPVKDENSSTLPEKISITPNQPFVKATHATVTPKISNDNPAEEIKKPVTDPGWNNNSLAIAKKEPPVIKDKPVQKETNTLPESEYEINNVAITRVPTNPKSTTVPVTNPPATISSIAKSGPVATPIIPTPKKEVINEPVVIPAIPLVKTSIAERNGAAVFINERKTEVSQLVNFKADSLELTLYDNGQIDGDTVSVLMNGEIILAKQGLKASAIRKTIYIAPGLEEFTLVLYAENLGSYPPNTGLLVVHDGDDVYNLRFSSDLQKNAGIVFRRK